MKLFKSLGAMVCATLLLAVPAADVAKAHTDLVLVNFGGSAARAQMLALLRPWQEQTGKFGEMEEYNGGIEEIRSQVEAANVKWDVIDMEYSDVIQACEQGLLEKIDPSILPPSLDGTKATDDFMPGAIHECGIGNVIWSTVYAYNNAAFPGTKPSTISDFFDIKKFPGKRGMRKDPRAALEWALMADGVAPKDVYSILATKKGQNRAFAKLESIKSEIVWWERGPEPARLLETGAVSMTGAWNGRLYRPIVEQKKDFVIVWDGQIWDIDLFAIPKGSPRLKNALDFIAYATSTNAFVEWTKYISYGPSRKSSSEYVAENTKPMLPTTEANMANALRNNSQWWAENIDAIRPRFDALTRPEDSGETSRDARF